MPSSRINIYSQMGFKIILIVANAPELADAHRASDERKSVSSPMSSEQVGVVHQFADWQRRLEGYLFGSVVAQRRDGCLALQTKSLRFAEVGKWFWILKLKNKIHERKN